jgi:hypothetical protein
MAGKEESARMRIRGGSAVGPDSYRMPFSSPLRRIALALSSWPSYYRIRSTRFATTVSSLSALERRVDDDPVEVRDHSKRVFPQRTIEHGVDSAGRPSEPSKTESYLLSLLTDGAMPTLHDLERLKPLEHPDPQLTEYAREYNTLLDNICRSFSNDQLRSFSQQYGLQLGSKRRKMLFAEAIVEKAWHWPPLGELKRAQRDRTEVASKSMCTLTFMPICLTSPSVGTHIKRALHSSWKRFVHTPPMLRCLTPLRDGSDLFKLSRNYNVHISVKRNPLAIYLEGSRESLRAAQKCIDDVRKARYFFLCYCFHYTHWSVGHCRGYRRHTFRTSRLTRSTSESFTPFRGFRGKHR